MAANATLLEGTLIAGPLVAAGLLTIAPAAVVGSWLVLAPAIAILGLCAAPLMTIQTVPALASPPESPRAEEFALTAQGGGYALSALLVAVAPFTVALLVGAVGPFAAALALTRHDGRPDGVPSIPAKRATAGCPTGAGWAFVPSTPHPLMRENMTITIANLIIPVADQEAALRFYTEVVGFEKRADLTFGGGLRWLEVGQAGSGTTIAICPPGPGVTPGGKETGISLHVEDADSFHAHLKDAGTDVDGEVGHFEGAPPTFWFRDPEGNSLMVSQAA